MVSRGYEVVGTVTHPNANWCRCLRTFNVIGDAIDGLGNLPKKQENGMSIHTVNQNLKIFNFI
jgi:F-type H+-transporting ATPase subunit beta